ncbi:MAG: hypothetical protein R3D26_11625 [Cyanobacteriota/Melainabacteria group bacterium]
MKTLKRFWQEEQRDKPDDWLMWNNLAVVLQQLNKNKECVAAIKKSMALNPPDYEKENMTSLKKLEASTN